MADHRSRREKLEAMAAQTESPQEAEVAKRLLEKMGPDERRGQKTSPKNAGYYGGFYSGRWGSINDDIWQEVLRTMEANDYFRKKPEPPKPMVRIVGGPWDGTTREDDGQRELRVLKPMDFDEMSWMYGKTPLDRPSFTYGTYRRQTAGDGTPFYMFMGWDR